MLVRVVIRLLFRDLELAIRSVSRKINTINILSDNTYSQKHVASEDAYCFFDYTLDELTEGVGKVI
jgi:hypothetical protein